MKVALPYLLFFIAVSSGIATLWQLWLVVWPKARAHRKQAIIRIVVFTIVCIVATWWAVPLTLPKVDATDRRMELLEHKADDIKRLIEAAPRSAPQVDPTQSQELLKELAHLRWQIDELQKSGKSGVDAARVARLETDLRNTEQRLSDDTHHRSDPKSPNPSDPIKPPSAAENSVTSPSPPITNPPKLISPTSSNVETNGGTDKSNAERTERKPGSSPTRESVRIWPPHIPDERYQRERRVGMVKITMEIDRPRKGTGVCSPSTFKGCFGVAGAGTCGTTSAFTTLALLRDNTTVLSQPFDLENQPIFYVNHLSSGDYDVRVRTTTEEVTFTMIPVTRGKRTEIHLQIECPGQ